MIIKLFLINFDPILFEKFKLEILKLKNIKRIETDVLLLFEYK